MSIEQVCLLVTLNILVGTYLAWVRSRNGTTGEGLALVATILTGIAMVWHSA